MIVYPRQCMACKNIDLESPAFTCRAFPDGIPAAILSNEFDHAGPFKGDRGIRFDPIDKPTGPKTSGG